MNSWISANPMIREQLPSHRYCTKNYNNLGYCDKLTFDLPLIVQLYVADKIRWKGFPRSVIKSINKNTAIRVQRMKYVIYMGEYVVVLSHRNNYIPECYGGIFKATISLYGYVKICASLKQMTNM